MLIIMFFFLTDKSMNVLIPTIVACRSLITPIVWITLKAKYSYS